VSLRLRWCDESNGRDSWRESRDDGTMKQSLGEGANIAGQYSLRLKREDEQTHGGEEG
jgi:hypothetical protein